MSNHPVHMVGGCANSLSSGVTTVQWADVTCVPCNKHNPRAHPVDPIYVPVCGICYEPIHQNDLEEWVHST